MIYIFLIRIIYYLKLIVSQVNDYILISLTLQRDYIEVKRYPSKKQMKERCWKELKNQLCPPQKWVKDSEHSKCQCCSKQFMLLIRRRHHCRFCGNLFCSECSDYFINGNYIGDTKQKYIRHCEFCHKKIEKFIREWTKMPEVYEQKNVQNNKEEDLSQDDEDEKQFEFNLNKMFEEAQKSTCQLNEVLGQRQNKILLQSSQALCDKFNISKDIWKQKIKDLAQRAANQTKMEVLVSENFADTAMDIAKRVKVRTIQSEGNKAVQAMVKGIVLQKNTATKSMQTHLSHPKVLIIQNSIDLDSLASFIKFEQLIKNDKAIMKKILQKIIKLNPDIIFVENNVHVFVLDYLQSKQIVVVNKLKQKQIQMIKQVTGIKKTVKKLWMLEKYKHNCIIGKCDKIYFKHAREGQMLMFIEAAQMGIRTILIGDQGQEQTNNLKKSVQILMRLARQLNLQKHFILVEKQIKDGIGKKQSILPIVQDFSPCIYENIQTFLFNQQLCFSKILYKTVKLSQSPKNFQEYAHKVGKASYKQICGKIQFLNKKIYSSTDLTLGAYILMAAANFQRPCKRCESNHKEQYYMEDFIVSISAQKKSNLTVSKSSSVSLIEYNQQEFTLQKIKNHLNKQKQLIVISTHASCQLCGNTVGNQNVKVGKLFLSSSFHHILHCLIIAFQQNLAQMKENFEEEQLQQSTTNLLASRKLSRRKLSIDRCQHNMLTRVYEYSGVQIKINIETATKYFVDYIDTTRKDSLEYIRVKQNKYIKSMYEFELNQKMRLLQKISGLLSSLPFPTSTTTSISIGPKIMIYFEVIMKIKQILEKCRVELKEVQAKSVQELEKPKHDWTVLTRRILKVQSILQMVFMIIDQIERNLRKKKPDQMNQTNNQNSTIIQNFESSPNNNEIMQQINDNASVINTTTTAPPQTCFDEQTKQYLKKKSRKIFPRVQGTILHFHPPNVSINDPVSLLACGINSSQYRRICQQEANSNPTQFTFRMNGYRKLKTDWTLRAETDKIYAEVFGDVPEKLQAIDITVFYPKQFEALRKWQGIDNELYIRGLCSCRSWDSSGGKSNSLFAKAENDLLVVKVINEKQFDQFLKFARGYINYLKLAKKPGRDTMLAKVFGIYQVSVKGKVYKCVVMQNIFFGLQTITKVYDLKGSQVNRLTMPPQGSKGYTGQDTNFKIDKQGQPYILKAPQYDKILQVLQQDANFLKENEVIDYSLLVIESKNTLRLGIIDYMRPYQLMEKIQTIYKQFKSRRDPTVIPPTSYAERFIGAMKRYFIKIQ